MNSDVHKQWERFLNPDVLRPNLIIASIYIAAFELLKTTIVDRIKTFYAAGFDKNGLIIDPKYQSDVLSKNRSPVYASLQWLKESHAIDDGDLAAFERAKECRNKFAHAITKMLTEGLPADVPTRFSELAALLEKIERWWILNVEIPTNPDFDGEEVNEEGVVPGVMIALRLMMEIALGSTDESRAYLDGFIRRNQMNAER